ncbi:MAG TPA: AAA family ATPase [Stellaceae bacterium]|nr:AAA family ATPase [Stellaceae bacterium]
MLKSLHLENFKSWVSADLVFGKVTGLFGTNSSGKSSLTQFMLLLKQTKEATDRGIALGLNGQYVNLGIFKDMIYGHSEESGLAWRLSFEREGELVLRPSMVGDPANPIRGRTLEVASTVRESGKPRRMMSADLEYAIGGVAFRLTRRNGSETSFELTAEPAERFRFIRNPGRVWQLPGPLKSYAFPDQARTYFQNASFLADLEKAYEEQMDGVYYLGPLREYPSRDYLWSRSRPVSVGVKGEETISAILAMTADGEQRNVGYKKHLRPFQEIVAYWLAALGVISDFKVEEIAEGSNRWQARVVTRRGAPRVLLTDVGFGVSQVLPVVTLLQYVPRGSTVILEQPEIHLHPLAQANLADVIINAAVHRDVQVIVESHSEHLLLRLQRRIAEATISGDDVALYFCDITDSGSLLRRLQMDLWGKIENWPTNFMGDAFGEAAETERARLSRIIAAQ